MNEKQKKLSLNGTMLRMCVGLFFGMILALSAFAGQVPTALDTATKCGDFQYVLNNSDLVGDLGGHPAPAMGDLDADGDLDMIVGTSDGFFRHFRNDDGTWVNINDDMFGDQGNHARPDLIDWDKDGDLDLFFVRGDSQISLYENVGTKEVPNFELSRDFIGTPWGYSGVSAADMDNDGDLDMVATSGATYNTYYYENYVNEAGIDYDRMNREYVGYINGYAGCYFLDYDYDNDFDAVCVEDDGKIYIHRNIGNSTYQIWDDRSFQESYVEDFSDYTSLEFIDFDNDGDYDMFTGNADGTVSYYEGTYSETGQLFDFTLNASNFLGSDVGSRASPAVFDIDNDGDLDMYVAEEDSNRITFFRNTGGTFGYVGLVNNLDGLGDTPRISFKDMNNDGVMDLMVSNSAGYFDFYENSGTVSSAVWEDQVTLIDIGSRAGADYEDIDGDGDLDVISSEADAEWARVYYNVGDASNPNISEEMTYASKTDISNGFNPDFFDMDNDGDLDLVTGEVNGYIRYWKNLGNNTHPDYEFIRTWYDAGDWSAPAMADIDNDGDYDLTWGRNNDGNLRQMENIGPTWSINWTLMHRNISADYGDYSRADFTDFDGDGDLDMLIGHSNGYIRYLRNDGNITDPVYTHIMRWDDVGDWAAPALGDFDNDGDYDYVWGRNNDGNLRYYENTATNNSINFTKTTDNISDDRGDYSMPYFGDLDNDGDLDMVVGHSDGIVKYYNNTGNATDYKFTYVSNLFDVGGWAAPALGDFDNDGDLDMITGRSDDYYLRYYENNGTVNRPDWNLITTDFLGYSIGREHNIPEIVDFDNDGDLDIITARYDGYIHYERNDGNVTDPSWTRVESWGDFGTHVSVAIGDFFNDGKNEMIVGNSDGIVNMYINNEVAPLYNWDYLRGYNFGEGGSYWMQDVGGHSVTRMVDIDADGDMDLLIGNTDGNIKFYENNGLYTDNLSLSTYPTFRNQNSNFINHVTSNHLIPRIDDMDNDGDLDLLIGDSHGYHLYYRNDGSPDNPNWVYQGNWIDTGSYSAPSYVDIDGDGIKDLATGSNDGRTRIYKNTGTNESPSFEYIYAYFAGDSDSLWIEDIGAHSNPQLMDWDSDGDLDMVMGRDDGSISIYENNGFMNTSDKLARYPAYRYASDNWVNHISSSYLIPKYFDWDSDGDLDLFVGNSHGYIYYYRNDGSISNPNWVYQGNWIDTGAYSSPEFDDFNGDGLNDMIVGDNLGYTKLYINEGSVESPVWRYIYAGEDGSSYLPDIGGHVNNFVVDLDNDGDKEIISCDYEGHCVDYRNNGLYTSEKEKAMNSMFYVVTSNWGTSNGEDYVNPKLADFDGDGDYDVISGLGNGYVNFWENTGNAYQYRWSHIGSPMDVGGYSDPGFGDMDNDGDLDLMVGNQDGYIKYYENQGSYNDSCITITNATNYAVSGVNVKFYNDSNDLVCDTTTDTNGNSRCNLTLIDEGKIQVANGPEDGFIQLGLTTFNSKGKTTKIIETKSSSYDINLKHFEVSTAGPKGDVNEGTQIRLYDRDSVAFKGHTNDLGYIDGFLPERYLVNRQEPFAQNRIMYDVDMLPNEYYGSHLRLEDVYMPNSLTLGHTNDANKLFKFAAAKFEVTDAQYKHYLIYPAVNAQKDFEFDDWINENFTFVNPVYVKVGNDEYLQECDLIGSSDVYSVNKTSTGCSLLGKEISASNSDGDWIVIEYTLESPGLAMFLLNGWSSQNFTFPSANLGLKS